MRIVKLLALMCIGSHLCTQSQEEPTVINQEESAAPEKTQQDIEQQNIEEDVEQQETEPQEIAAQPQAIEIPAVPEPAIEDASTITKETMSQSPIGIDTVSLEEPQGNWLFKRIWWERAEERYEKIRLLVNAIWESRTRFFMQRNELDKQILTPFYLNAGMRLGELQTILSDQLELLEKQREQEGDLTEQEREMFESLTTEQDSLKQLKTDVDAIANLDGAIDNALIQLMKQINEAKNLENQAWKNFKEIAHILNDVKARDLYYMIEGAARNIKNINTYLEQSFLTHFDTLINETKNHIQKVQARMQALKEKGITFKSQTEQLAIQQEQERQQADEEAADQEEEESRPKPKTGWFNWIISGIKNIFSRIISIIKWPFIMIFGKK